MATYRTDMLARLIAMEAEALDADIVTLMGGDGRTGITAVPTIFYEQSALPYIVHRVGPSIPENIAEDMSIRTYDVFIRVVIGHLTANYLGENEALVDEIIPLLEEYLLKHPMLTTDAGVFATQPTWLHSEGIELGETTGVISFEIGGIGSEHVGEELSISMSVIRTLEQS
ncbi:hypothetical protein KAR91_17870 [Candidatus Pacearchaeota archaeon]|nr:hypothetical protein [Candidatus Pacearchaeota archaeon]